MVVLDEQQRLNGWFKREKERRGGKERQRMRIQVNQGNTGRDSSILSRKQLETREDRRQKGSEKEKHSQQQHRKNR